MWVGNYSPGGGDREGIRREELDVDLTKEFYLFMKFSVKYNKEWEQVSRWKEKAWTVHTMKSDTWMSWTIQEPLIAHSHGL